MPAALDASAYIYEGVWTNWSEGKILGLTLTLSPKNEAILSPAIAIVISMAGAQLWRLFQFALHQSRATSKDKDFLYHQQQVTLRNTSTDLNTLWRLFRIGIAWRTHKNIKSFRRTVWLALWTLFHLVVVVLAGLFSSTLLDAGTFVLSRSPWCGTFNNSYTNAIATGIGDNIAEITNEYYNYVNSLYYHTKQYVDICSEGGAGCDILPQKELPWNATILNQSCPFSNSSICNPGGYGSIAFDTGFVSSHTHLGINAVKSDRISIRMMSQCAPLDDREFITDWHEVPATGDRPALQVVDAHYGPGVYSERNSTYSYSDYRQYMQCENRASVPSYMMESSMSAAGGSVDTGESTFSPISQLSLPDADTTLAFLMFDNVYSTQVEDPWFKATTLINDTDAFCEESSHLVYGRDLPLSTLGCTQQVQVCRGDDGHLKDCSDPMGTWQLMMYASDPPVGWSEKQASTLRNVAAAASGATAYWIITGLALTDLPLLAKAQISQTMSLPLPENQWQLETKYWQSLALAQLQKSVINLSTGQFSADTSYINQTMLHGTSADKWLCSNQLIRSHSYRNFNFFGLIFVLVLSTVIIILGLSIEDLISFIRQRQLRYTIGKQDMWVINSDLEMLRVLSEVQNGAKWTRSKNGIPLSAPGLKVGVAQLRPNYTHSRHNTSLSEISSAGYAKSPISPDLSRLPVERPGRKSSSAITFSNDISPTRAAAAKQDIAQAAPKGHSRTRSSPNKIRYVLTSPTPPPRGASLPRNDSDRSFMYGNPYSSSIEDPPASQQDLSATSPMLAQQQRQPPVGWGVLPPFSGDSRTRTAATTQNVRLQGSDSDDTEEERDDRGRRRLSAMWGSTWGGRPGRSYVQ